MIERYSEMADSQFDQIDASELTLPYQWPLKPKKFFL